MQRRNDDKTTALLMRQQNSEAPSVTPQRLIPSRMPSSTCYSDDDETASEDEQSKTKVVSSVVRYLDDDHWTVPGMTTQQLRSFFAWAFFASDEASLNETDRSELHACMEYLKAEIRVHGDDTAPPRYTPRRLTLEDVNPWHRGIWVYALVYGLRCLAGFILRLVGFRFVQSGSGVRGWVRTAKGGDIEKSTPLVFFHGIAPAAILLYLPMVLFGMRAKNCLLIENPNISCCIQFNALSESATVEGVEQLVQEHFGKKPVVLAGHSFGSCPVSWILNHRPSLEIADIILLDPVTILLSESDVMINFLYSQEKIDKIRMVASSELFTEYYLRRHFAWYNSELWLEEHSDRRMFVALAEHDEIVNAFKVHRHAQRHQHVETIVWDSVGHGSVVVDSSKWGVLRHRLGESGVI